jgi:hypothetical protein
MDAETLLVDLRAHFDRVEPGPEGKIIVFPRDRATPELIELILENKLALLRLLRAEQERPRIVPPDDDRLDLPPPPNGGRSTASRTSALAEWSETHSVDISIVGEILKIERQALALGWRYERLWTPKFWPHRDARPRGLASVLGIGDKLGVVTAEWIEIRVGDGRGTVQRFRRCDA